jgi:3-hydroxybutyryl-CoA dehydrogenase
LNNAVRMLENGTASRDDIDTAMKGGCNFPMGPLALLDLVGLDVAKAIGETIGAPVPPRVEQLIAEDALGRKSGRGFHSY